MGKGGISFPGSEPQGSLSLRIPDGGAGLAPVFSPLAFQGLGVGVCGLSSKDFSCKRTVG